MLEKGNFSQQDVNYAFALSKKETSKNLSFYGRDKGSQFEGPIKDFSFYSATNVYQMQIMKSVFGDMGSRVAQEFQKGKSTTVQGLIDWVVKDMSDNINENQDGMTMILCGIKNSIKDPDEKKIRTDAVGLLTRWVYQHFKDRVNSDKILNRISTAVTNDKSPVTVKINSMTADIAC